MILTVFRNRLNQDHSSEYHDLAPRIAALAVDMPGSVWHKSFAADDGERVTIVQFDDEASHQTWARHPEHRAAMEKGRDRFYEFYDLRICSVGRSSSFEA